MTDQNTSKESGVIHPALRAPHGLCTHRPQAPRCKPDLQRITQICPPFEESDSK